MHISCLYSWTIPHMWLSKIHNFIAQNGYLSTTFTNISKRHRKYNNYESAQVSFSLVQIWGTCMLYLSISISRYISEANTLLLTPIYSSDRFSHRLLFRQVLVLQWLGRCPYSNATMNIFISLWIICKMHRHKLCRNVVLRSYKHIKNMAYPCIQ